MRLLLKSWQTLAPLTPGAVKTMCNHINRLLLSEPCTTNTLQCCEAGERSFIDDAASHGGRRGQQDVKTQTNTDYGTRPCEKKQTLKCQPALLFIDCSSYYDALHTPWPSRCCCYASTTLRELRVKGRGRLLRVVVCIVVYVYLRQ